MRPALGFGLTNRRGSSPEASISSTTLRNRSLRSRSPHSRTPVRRSLHSLYRLVLHSLYSPALHSLRSPALHTLRNLDEQLYRRVATVQSFHRRNRTSPG